MMTMPSSAGVLVGKAGREPQAVAAEDPDVMIVGTVHAPIEQVWALFRPFGAEMMRWWPIYDWVVLEPPGVDEVGAVRYFKANGATYREKLIVRDDKTHTEQYAYVSSDAPVPIKSVITTVQMIAKGNLETEVRWSSKTEMSPLLAPFFMPLVKHTQRQAYYGAIQALARYFNPVTDVLEIKVTAADIPAAGLLPPNPYVVLEVDGALPQRTGILLENSVPWLSKTLGLSPIVHFNCGAFDDQLRLAVWDTRVLRDEPIGHATVDLSRITNGKWVEQTVLLEGPKSGQLTIEMRYKPLFDELRKTMSLAKTLGSSLGKYVPQLGQLGFEIGIVDTTLANVEFAARDRLMAYMPAGTKLTTFDPGRNVVGTLLLDLRRAISGVQNTIQGLAGQAMALAQQIHESIVEGEQPVYGYARYPRMPQIPDVPLENLPRMVSGLPINEVLPPSKLGGMVQRGLEYAFSEFNLVDRYKEAILQKKDPFKAFLDRWVQAPEQVLEHWRDDVEFCRQLIQGLNPLMIRTVRSMEEIPKSMVNLSAQGKSLPELIKAGRLFILDYALLSKLKLYRNMVFYAPIVLVYRELLPGGESRLNLVGIQLTRDEGHNVVYTASGSPPNRYLYAKIQVACADNQYHQFIYHLGLAHLSTEPMVIAHHNAFYYHKEHPIGKLLAPHFRETIGINYLARQTLVASPDVAFTDRTFAPGTAQALQLFLMAWEQYDFFANSFPEDLARRGFDEAGNDGVQDYYFRDDGFKIWNAISEYVKDVVESVYHDDAAVAADPVLQAWAHECSAPDRADIPGFPQAITTRALLVKTLTTIIFHTSAFHSAVNFPQIDYLSYVPNRPDATFEKMPDGDDDITMEWILMKGMPNFFISNFQISFALLLTLPSDAPLSDLRELAAEFPEAHKRFMANLDAIARDIEERNEKLVKAGKQPYPYLLPSRIASSVAI